MSLNFYFVFYKDQSTNQAEYSCILFLLQVVKKMGFKTLRW